MKKAVMIFVFLLIAMPSVLADWFYNSRNIIANIDIYGSAEIVTTTGYIESATANLTFFPKEYDTQDLLNFYTSPEADVSDKSLKFTWKRPEGKIDFRIDADVKTINTIIEVREKIKFPIEELPEDIVAYTKPTETIDSNDESIVRIASELVKGEDDLYAAVFKIADWTKNNINYNLSTLTEKASLKASWVLANKQGVCDELTSLFIALLRAVGVPARFISGISYTNSPLFPENWGAHGWAEVYFPGYGWVPFDVTYGEFGWVDPTHIKFKESLDSDEPSTYYQWLGRNADLSTRDLDIKTNLIGKSGYYKIPISLEASVFKKSISFGSYNFLEAAIENLNDFYYATELYLNKPKEVDITGNELKSILLLPKEKKKVFWILKVDESLNSKYLYTFPLVVSTLNNITSETSFTSSSREKEVTFEEIEQIAKLLEQEEQKKYSGNVLLDCKAEKVEFYEYEDAKLYCNVKNTGNIFLEDVNVCFESKCKNLDLGIAQTKNVTFKINNSIIGQRESPVILSNELVSKAAYVNFKINDLPKIEIEADFPVNVSYDDVFAVSFTIAKGSQSAPKNVEVIFMQNGVEKGWRINDLLEDRKFIVEIEGKQLNYGKNSYKIDVSYFDGLNKKYNAHKEFSIGLYNANIAQRILLSLNRFEGISHEAIAIMLLTGTIAFILVVLWLFRKGRK